MKHVFAWSVIVLMIAISACAPSPQSPGATAQPPVAPVTIITPTTPAPSSVIQPTATRLAPPTIEPTLVPVPLNVKVQVDDHLAASAVISSTGGTVSVKAADGTKFTLEIPKDALFQEEKITLTPVTSVQGLPFSGGLVGSVQMAPEGLRLFQPASLTIETSRAAPAAGYRLVAFAYHKTGEGFYLTPEQSEGNKIAIPVWHFSGSGAASGTAAEVQAQQQREPADSEDAMQQQMQDYLTQQQQAAKDGKPTDPELRNKIKAYLRDYFERFIKPKLAPAANDCEAAKAILPKAIMWSRQVALLGLQDEMQDETSKVTQAMEDALVNCYNKEFDECVVDNQIKHKAAMLVILRQAALLGLLDRFDQTKVEKCPQRSYRVDQVMGEGAHVTGTICSLTEPFKLDDSYPTYGAWVWTFTPSSEKGGSVSLQGTIFSVGAQNGRGTYKISGIPDKPVIHVSSLSVTTAGVGTASAAGPDLALEPVDPGANCK